MTICQDAVVKRSLRKLAFVDHMPPFFLFSIVYKDHTTLGSKRLNHTSQLLAMRALKIQGEVTPIGAVSRAATGVKMRSNGQGTFWGLVKRSSSVLGHYRSISTALLAIKRRGRSFCACAINQWSRVKGKNPAWSSG